MDFGYPQNLSAEILKLYITQEGVRSPFSSKLREDWFTPAEPSIKRTHIERLISGLVNSKSEECPPSVGSSMHRSPKNLNTTDGFEDGIQFTIKSGPLGGCHVSSQCQVKQGIEMTLLPTSPAKSPQCTRTSGLVLKELFQQVPAPESYTDCFNIVYLFMYVEGGVEGSSRAVEPACARYR